MKTWLWKQTWGNCNPNTIIEAGHYQKAFYPAISCETLSFPMVTVSLTTPSLLSWHHTVDSITGMHLKARFFLNDSFTQIRKLHTHWTLTIDHFTVVCLVTWPLNESEAGVDLVLIETSLLFICKFLLTSMRTASLTWEKQGGFYQNKVTSSLTFIQRPGN